MPATKPTLDLSKLNVGRAYVWTGDLTTVGGMAPLGNTEGAISAEVGASYSTLTLPEITGDTPLDVQVSGGTVAVTIPLLIGDAALWAKLSPKGVRAGGRAGFTNVTTTGLMIVPETELAADGSISYADDPATTDTSPVWTPAVPEHALFVWRGYFEDVTRTYQHNQDRNKTIVEARFVGMYHGAAADGYRVWAQGGAAAVAGLPAIRI
jgi:hypothetical protein